MVNSLGHVWCGVAATRHGTQFLVVLLKQALNHSLKSSSLYHTMTLASVLSKSPTTTSAGDGLIKA